MKDLQVDIHRVIDDLEARAREHEQKAQKCREAVEAIRDVWGVSTLSQTPARTPTAQDKPERKRPRGRVVRAATTAKNGDNTAAVLEWLQKQPEPAKFKDLCAALNVSKVTGRNAVQQLIASGQAMATGARSSYRLAAVRGKAPAAATSTPADLQAALMGLFGSGASYTSAEIMRAVRQKVEGVDGVAVEGALSALLSQRKIGRIDGADGTRYRKVAK